MELILHCERCMVSLNVYLENKDSDWINKQQESTLTNHYASLTIFTFGFKNLIRILFELYAHIVEMIRKPWTIFFYVSKYTSLYSLINLDWQSILFGKYKFINMILLMIKQWYKDQNIITYQDPFLDLLLILHINFWYKIL